MDNSWVAEEAGRTVGYAMNFLCQVDFSREKPGRQSPESDTGKSPLFLWAILSPAAFPLLPSLKAALLSRPSFLSSLLLLSLFVNQSKPVVIGSVVYIRLIAQY